MKLHVGAECSVASFPKVIQMWQSLSKNLAKLSMKGTDYLAVDIVDIPEPDLDARRPFQYTCYIFRICCHSQL
jgi:hypothetical protein